jgi:hypothetical protein
MEVRPETPSTPMERTTVDDEQLKGGRPEQIDFPPLWYLARGAQVLVAVVFAKGAYLNRGNGFLWGDLFSFIPMLLVIWWFSRGVATGTVDSSGIRYRQYFLLKTINWAQVQEIQWVGFRLKIFIRRANRRKRALVFLLNTLKSLGPYWVRMQALPLEAPVKMASAAPYSKWIYRFFFGVMILFFLVFLWRLLSTAPWASH